MDPKLQSHHDTRKAAGPNSPRARLGAGYIAREQLSCLTQLRNVEIVGICDRSAVMAEATADPFRVPNWFTELSPMLQSLEPEVVHITTPPRSHVPIALEALDTGAHVFIEKPISAADIEETRSLVFDLLGAVDRSAERSA